MLWFDVSSKGSGMGTLHGAYYELIISTVQSTHAATLIAYYLIP